MLTPPIPDVGGARKLQRDDERTFMPDLKFIATMIPEI